MKLCKVFHTSNSFRSFCPRCLFPSSQHQYIAPTTLPTQCSWDSVLKWISYHFRIIYFCRARSDHFLILSQSTAPQIAVPPQRWGRGGERQQDAAVPLASSPLSVSISWSHGLAQQNKEVLSGQVRSTAPSHSCSWGKTPSIPLVYSLQKLKDSPGKDTAPGPKRQPSPSSHPLGEACPAPSSQAQLTQEPSLATRTSHISFPKETGEAWKAEQLPAAFCPNKSQKDALLAE